MSEIPVHSCVTAGPGITFCHPTTKEGSYFLGFDPSVHQDSTNDFKMIASAIGPRPNAPIPVPSPPKEFADKMGWRFYDITKTLPSIIPDKDWKYGASPGPNCYQAALCSAGLDYVCGRYVDTDEAEFLLGKFFHQTQGSKCGNRFGTIAVFTEGMPEGQSKHFGLDGATPEFLPPPSRLIEPYDIKLLGRRHAFIPKSRPANTPYVEGLREFYSQKLPFYSAGTHMIFSLFGGLVFHKLSYYYNDSYRIDPISQAMKQVDAAAVSHMDKFDRLSRGKKEHHYKWTCYQLKADPTKAPKSEPTWSNEERLHYIRLFTFYSQKIREVAKNGTWGKFDQERLSLLTIENFWSTLREFKEKVGWDTKNFLSQDWELAKAFYTATSLSWQYQSMSDTYYRMTERNYKRRLKELYVKHYVKFDKNFQDEIMAHLAVRGVPQKLWPAIVKTIGDEITSKDGNKPKYNPLDYHLSNGTKGIPFFDILDQAIAAHTK